MKHKKNPSDWINKFKLNHKIIYWINKWLCRTMLFLLFLFLINKFAQGTIQLLISNSEVVVVLASLLGAVTGGFITHLTNSNSIAKTNHIQSSINNKRTIYTPLLLEFRNIHKKLKSGEIFRFDNNSLHPAPIAVEYSMWFKIKEDERFFQLSDYYMKECENVETLIKDYISKQNNIQIVATEKLKEAYNNLNYDIGIDEYRNLPSILIKKERLIDGKNSVALNETNFWKSAYTMLLGITEQEQKQVASDFYTAFLTSKVLDEYTTSKQDLVDSLETVIKTTEAIIRRITTDYELRNNIF